MAAVKQKESISDRFKKFSVAALTALFVLTLTIIFPVTPLIDLELKLIDKRFEERGELKIDSPKVVIVEISGESFKQIPPPHNKWPWPRFLFAKLVKNLTDAGVRAIGIDILLSEEDRYSPVNDSLLIEAIRSSGKVVLGGKIDIEREALLAKVAAGDTLWRSGKERALITEFDENFKAVKENFGNYLFLADSSIGIVNIPSDNDDVKRRYNPYTFYSLSEEETRPVPTFSFAVLNKYFGKSRNYTAENADDKFNFAGIEIPKFTNSGLLINYYGGYKSFPYYKFFEIIDDSSFRSRDEIEYETDLNEWETYMQQGIFRDKIVLVGSTMPEDKDIFPISFSKGRRGDNLIPGVEIHATVIQNVLDRNFLERQSAVGECALIVLITFFVFYGASYLKSLKFRYGLALELGIIVTMLALVFALYRLSIYFFIEQNLVIAVVSPALALIFSYITSTAYHFIQERRQNVMIKEMFSQYVSKAVVNELIANPDKLRLGGERKNITILFSDIAGFTTFSEKKKPEELVSLINEYLNEMSEIVMLNEGTVDKYLGDAIMAFWGAPVKVEDHALKACITALRMQEKLAELREKWSQSGEVQIRIRIGINTGDVIVGNIGGQKRFDYTVLGDSVNLASRLEGANKEYGTNIMISDSTYEPIKDKVLVRELDLIRVKGKTEPTKVYELISLKGDSKALAAIEQMHEYSQGLELYKFRSFEVAMDYFRRSFEKLNDYPSKVYMERCRYYVGNPPAEDWDGVFELKTK